MSQSGFEPTARCPHRWCPLLHNLAGWALALAITTGAVVNPWLLIFIAGMLGYMAVSGMLVIRVGRTRVAEAQAMRPAETPVVVDPRWALIAAGSDAVQACAWMLLALWLADLLPSGGLFGSIVFWAIGIPVACGPYFRHYAHGRASRPRPRRRRRVRVRNAKPVRFGRLAPAGT